LAVALRAWGAGLSNRPAPSQPGGEDTLIAAASGIALVERLRSEARVHEDVVSRLLERLLADERELNDLRAVRDALTPPELASRPGVELAASFLETTTLLVGDVVGKGLGAARRGGVHPHGVRDHRAFLGRSGTAAQLGEHVAQRTTGSDR
jgi:hypothetical protein